MRVPKTAAVLATRFDVPSIRVPRTKEENRELKSGFFDENNEELAYFSFRLLWPSIGVAIFSLLCFVGAVLSSLAVDFVPSPEQLFNGFVVAYGSSRFACNSSVPIAADALPSLLGLFELNVPGNILFRCAVVLPLAVRVFHAYCVRTLLAGDSSSGIFRLLNDLGPLFTALEVLASALFSIITVHNDFPEMNRFCKLVFGIAAAVNMLLLSLVTFSHGKNSSSVSPLPSTLKRQRWDTISLSVKLVSSLVFCYISPQYFQYHHSSISFPICHSYLPRYFALLEYCMAASYSAFHLSVLIDIRSLRFSCYPRTCSGECEPLEPANFARGGRFEHCRAFELRQRQLAKTSISL